MRREVFSLTSNDRGDGEEPGPGAQLKIELRDLKAQGTVPSGDAGYFIRTIGIVGSVVTSTAGAAVFRGTPYLAVAALILGLVAIVLIAVRGSERRRLPARRGRARPGEDDASKPLPTCKAGTP